MSIKPFIIKGGIHHDHRGSIKFINDWDFKGIRRMYQIHPKDNSIIRAWQGHKNESKWFYVISGSFIVRLIRINDWTCPSKVLPYDEFLLKENKSQVLYIPPGYVNGFRSTEQSSSLMVFSDKTLEESKSDDYRYPQDYWNNW